MAQHDYIISNATFPAVRTDINNALSAIQTNNSGTSLPTGAVAGQIWLDTTNATSPTLKFYDGTDSISLATINYTANTVDWLDSTVSVTGLSTTATGTVLTLSDTATTSSVNLIIDNDKEIRFREATANGTNYVSLSAPTSLASDLTFTLPSADGASGQALITNGSGVLSFASAGISWQSVQTTGFTASAGKGYPLNTTSSAFTVTLPASPSVGDTIILVDYAGTFATNGITLSPNGNKIESGTGTKKLETNREAVTLTYVDSTQGWISTSGANEGTQSIDPNAYSIDFLVIAGGGGGGALGGGGGAGGYRTSTQSVPVGTAITITVGDGGAGGTGFYSSAPAQGVSGSNSSISGSGITTITSAGGGGAGRYGQIGSTGGSGGGNGSEKTTAAAVGNTPSTSPSQGNDGGSASTTAPNYGCGGGGGASSVGGTGTSVGGGNGGSGTASSITGSSVTRAGGGGGGSQSGGTGGSGGSGGGGTGTNNNTTASSGTANTGSGGGGGGYVSGDGGAGGAGGKGVVILSVPTTKYSSTTTGSPTVTTSGSNTIMQFNGSGSYTA
jgi:hypothetical protein